MAASAASDAPALTRGLAILEMVARGGALPYTTIETRCGYNVSSLNRFLKTLLDSGYLQKNALGHYELGLRAFAVALGRSMWKTLTNRAEPVLARLSDEYELAAALIGYVGDGITVLAKHAHQDNVMLRKVGEEKSDFLLSPWGFVYVADLTDAERTRFLKGVRSKHEKQYKLPSDREVKRTLDFVRANGYADDRGKVLSRKVRRLAVPVRVADGRLIGSLAIASFAPELDDRRAKRLATVLKREAAELSAVFA